MGGAGSRQEAGTRGSGDLPPLLPHHWVAAHGKGCLAITPTARGPAMDWVFVSPPDPYVDPNPPCDSMWR